MKIHHLKPCPLSKSNIFYQNFMKLGHIVEYHGVFFKFDNGPYHTMGGQWLSGRLLDSRQKGRRFEPHWCHCVVVLEQDTFIKA